MRNVLTVVLVGLMLGCATSSENGRLQAQPGASPVARGELKIEIHPPSTDLFSTGQDMSVQVEGVASAVGGVRFIDMMLVLDTSLSLRESDPDYYRTTGAIGLIESLSPKSDTWIGVVGFDGDAELTQALTSNRPDVVQALKGMKSLGGGTELATGIFTALKELNENGRPGSSRVIVMFTDGRSSRKTARKAARKARSQGVAINTVLLGSNVKGASILEEIARGTAGSFVEVNDPSKLPEAFLNLRTTGVDTVTLSVNGARPVPARLAGGTFTGNVSLEAGENRIVALATSLDGQTTESVVTVSVRDASCATLAVTAMSKGRPALSLNERAVEIVVDASRSMWGQMRGQAKMAVAKEILQDVSDWLPDDLDLALRAYGNASPSDDRDCADSALLVPFGKDNRESIRAAISGLRPLGQTPIAYALNQAAGDFAMHESERTLVLITDGIESCGGDPVAVARALRKQDITIHLIGFGMDNAVDEDAASLQAIADASGGHFFTASSAEELKTALQGTVGTRFRVLQDNTVVARGALGSEQPLLLPNGDYLLELDSVPPHEVRISLAPRDELTLTLEKKGGVVSQTEHRGQLQPTFCEDGSMARSQDNGAQTLTTSATAHLVEPVEPEWFSPIQ